jgi:hypothetical protein
VQIKEALEKIQATVELACEVTLEPGHAAFEDFLSKKVGSFSAWLVAAPPPHTALRRAPRTELVTCTLATSKVNIHFRASSALLLTRSPFAALENHLQRDFKASSRGIVPVLAHAPSCLQEETAKQALQNAWTTGVLKIVPGVHKKVDVCSFSSRAHVVSGRVWLREDGH